MEKLMEYFRMTWYLEPLFACVCIICFMISIKLKGRHHILDNFRFYFAGFTVLNLHFYLAFFYSHPIKAAIYHHLDYFFTIFEFLVFTRIFSSGVDTHLKKITNILTVGFLIIAAAIIVYNIYTRAILTQESKEIFFTIQAVFLLIPCAFYFTQLFKIPTNNLENDPRFWVATGVGMFMLSTLPLSFCLNYFSISTGKLHEQLFTIFDAFYIMLFLMILRAYLCKPFEVLHRKIPHDATDDQGTTIYVTMLNRREA